MGQKQCDRCGELIYFARMENGVKLPMNVSDGKRHDCPGKPAPSKRSSHTQSPQVTAPGPSLTETKDSPPSVDYASANANSPGRRHLPCGCWGTIALLIVAIFALLAIRLL